MGVFILNIKDELLLLNSHKWPGKFVVPGGHIELGETLEDAVKREAKEETGLDVYNLKFICFQEFIFDPSFWEPRHFIFFDYFCNADSLNVQLNHEAESYGWFKIDVALSLPIDSYSKKTIHQFNELCH